MSLRLTWFADIQKFLVLGTKNVDFSLKCEQQQVSESIRREALRVSSELTGVKQK